MSLSEFVKVQRCPSVEGPSGHFIFSWSRVRANSLTSSSCLTACHKTLSVTSHALKLCHTLLAAVKWFCLPKGKSARAGTLNPAAGLDYKFTLNHKHPPQIGTHTYVITYVTIKQKCI